MSQDPRTIAREITMGLRPNQFIGPKSKEVLEQELFSILNGWDPSVMMDSEKKKWDEKYQKLVKEITDAGESDLVNKVKEKIAAYKKYIEENK